MDLRVTQANQAPQRTRRERRGGHRCVPWAGSLSLGRSANKMKRHTAIVISMSLLSSILFGAPKSGPANDKWIIAKVTAPDGTTGVFRYVQAKPEGWKTVPLSEEVSISWKYEGALPDEATSKRMNELEDALEALSVSKTSHLVLVMTVGGLREWCFYTRDYDAFMKTLNVKLSGKATFPISIEHSHDSEWKYWHSFVDKVEKNK
jgi:hypothetical protein